LLVAEFADFQCRPCAVQDRTMDELWAAYPDQIRYSFRHFPLTRLHSHAEAAALESQCAAGFGKFWETKRLLFANQHRLGEILGSVLPTIAPSDARKYQECVDSKSTWADVQKDVQQAERLGIRRTPSIVIGNKLIVGMVSYPRLEAIVRHELRARSGQPQEARRTLKPACGSPLSPGSCAE
jgi:protein-disulfide isomerase